jgi:hypothetical protein
LIDEELVVVEVQVGENLVLVEQVIADCCLAEEICLAQRHLLPMTAEQEEQLGLKRGARSVGVEIGQERIFGILQDRRRIQSRREPFSQRGLANTDRTLDRDVTKVQVGPMISSRHHISRRLCDARKPVRP